MTGLRDEIAIRAMDMLVKHCLEKSISKTNEAVSKDAYALADAVLA